MRKKTPLFDRPDPATLLIQDRCRFYAEQLDHYARHPDTGLLELMAIRRCLEAAAAALEVRRLPIDEDGGGS